ncbi:Asp-tRNA(Asn)/Glu-tRNA(Gln) amidotransferase subunit GatC [Candidatus Aerophobetes bacterium]|nr:Asp-tRNA(Asn)/Glu-tRNA(Gln) amidotransferase subunit GatC [Candidatus Aerophobetes bacterium]
MKKKIIDIDQVRYIAHLARLDLSPQEEEKFTHQLERILSYVEKLQELDTKDIPPTSHVLAVNNVFREDELSFSLSSQEALSNAPSRKDSYFKVPKIVG